MIRYRLECDAGHQFEAWFASSATYDRQEAGGLLECPHCTSRAVHKALMAPNVATRKGKSEPAEPREEAPAAESEAPAHPMLLSDSPEAVALRQVYAVLRVVRDKVRAETEYVGPRFAEEARRIHHEEAPDRGIYGEATPAEVEELAEEGIDVTPLPRLPDDLT